jgi:hypothetical protein
MRKNGPSVDKKESQLNIMTWLLRFEGEKGGAGPLSSGCNPEQNIISLKGSCWTERLVVKAPNECRPGILISQGALIY